MSKKKEEEKQFKQSLLSGDDLDESDEQDEVNDASDSDAEYRELRTLPNKSSDDQLMIAAITVALQNTKRKWSVPDKFTAVFALLGGVGAGSVIAIILGMVGVAISPGDEWVESEIAAEIHSMDRTNKAVRKAA